MEYDKKALEAAIQTKKMGHPVSFYEKTDTTANRIRELALQGAAEGALAVAEVQTAGRGRRSRPWQSPAGTGIWMSLLLRPDILPAQASTLTLLAGIAIAEAMEELTGLAADIKWPNDILLHGKKLVGILTEMDCDTKEIHSVTIGVGINVNTKTFPEELQEIATSMYLESGREYDRCQVVARCMAHFEALYEAFLKAGGSFAPFQERYCAKCLNIGKRVRVIGRESFLATALEITSEGELLVKREDNGRKEVVFSGEVSIRGEEK